MFYNYSIILDINEDKQNIILIDKFKLFEKEKFDIVINFAAESHVDNSIKNPTIFLETNIIVTIIFT